MMMVMTRQFLLTKTKTKTNTTRGERQAIEACSLRLQRQLPSSTVRRGAAPTTRWTAAPADRRCGGSSSCLGLSRDVDKGEKSRPSEEEVKSEEKTAGFAGSKVDDEALSTSRAREDG